MAFSFFRMAPAALVAGLLAAGCNPTFNWREAPLGGDGLVVLLPCKPDRATRDVTLADERVALEMAGCEAGDATFTVARTVARDAPQATARLHAWQAALAANLRDAAPQESPATVAGAVAAPAPVRIVASGTDAQGRPAQSQSLWFAGPVRGGPPGALALYQASVLGQPREPEAVATFFAGLRLP
ncbi:MAG: hypothetical protein JWQ03_2501 [Variovorax sp.]|nr:hypothetical protein [Variovorax sp.]